MDTAAHASRLAEQLAEKVSPEALAALVAHPELAQMITAAAAMEPAARQRLMKSAGRAPEPHRLPAVNADFLGQLDDVAELTTAQRQAITRLRAFMAAEVAPIADEYWERAEFPHHLIPKLAGLGLIEQLYTARGHESVFEGIITLEMARVDPSFATFFGVHSGLALGSILLCGSAEQRAEWLPKMQRWEAIGSFGLTEPDVGSGVAGGLTTTCRREGDTWILDGAKKWIGNATFADFTIIWARDVSDGEVKGFIVDTSLPGFSAIKMEGKVAQRLIQNANITLAGVRVPESSRLSHANSFRDTARVLGMTRVGVAWIGVGCATGAYEKALAYAQERAQFGRPLARFQLIQQMLVRMITNLSAMQALALRVSRMQDAGKMRDEHAAMAKMYCAAKCREVVALARESMGGNGILLDHGVARLFADAEAIYSYEGSNEINTLIVGRAITGFGAFV